MTGRKYEVPLAQHKRMKEQFLSGKTIREMAIEHNMQNLEVLSFIRWTAKEFKLEQLLRMDQALGQLMRVAQELLNQAHLSAQKGMIGDVAEALHQVDKVLARFSVLAGERELLMPSGRNQPKGPDGKFLPREDAGPSAGALESVLEDD